MSYERMQHTTDPYNVNHLINYFQDGLQHTKRSMSLFPQANCKQLLINIWHDVKKRNFFLLLLSIFLLLV